MQSCIVEPGHLINSEYRFIVGSDNALSGQKITVTPSGRVVISITNEVLRSRSGHIEYYSDEVLNVQFYNDGIYISQEYDL